MKPGPAPVAGASPYEQLVGRRRDRPMRELPALSRTSLRLVRRAAPRTWRVEVVLSIVGGALTAAQLVLTRDLLRALVDIGDGRRGRVILWPLVGFVLVYAAGQIVSLVQSEMRRILGELVARHAQSLVARAAASARLVDFERPAFHDRLQRAMANAASRPVQVAYALMSLATAVMTTIGVMVALAVVQPVLLAFVVVAFAPLWVVSRAISRLAFSFEVEQTEADRRRGYLLWLLTDKGPAKEVRAFGLDDHFDAEHQRLWSERIERLRAVAGRRARVGVVGRLVNAALFGLIVGGLAWMLSTGRTSVTDAAVAAGAMLLLGARLSSAASSVGQLYECSLFLHDVMEFLDEASANAAIDLRDDAPPFERLDLRGVRFRYPASTHDALKGIDLQVRRGEVVALVGANGSGKTTLAKVVAQLYEPTSGHVEWNGAQATTFGARTRRAQVAVVFQDFEKYLFTARENVGFGDAARLGDHDRIDAAARRAGAAAAIEALPHGYDTLLGPQFLGGSDLSIGQWQRVAIARAFFRDAGLVILDEPSAALDPDAEAALFDRVRELCRDRAVILVSHRFSTVRRADRIVVLDDGLITEEGDHDSLIARRGTYARMYAQQASAFVDLAQIDREAPAS